MAVADRSVMLGWVHAGTVRAEFMRSVLAVTTGRSADPRIGETADETAGSLIPKARNLLAARFLRSAAEWLWMVDTDVTFTPRALPALAATADPASAPAVTGIVFTLRPEGRVPALYTVTSGPRFRPLPNWVPGETVRVGACGAACLLTHRSVFEKIEAAEGPGWFNPRQIPAGVAGEDLSFCLRVTETGFPIHAVTGVTCGHLKTVTIGTPAP